LRES
jgi:thiamine pyrophosphate-dependent acetolactate synthase large subunit-like protein